MAQLQQESPGRYVMKDLYLFSCEREILARKLETLPLTIPLKPIRPETALRRALSLNLDQSATPLKNRPSKRSMTNRFKSS
jgi:hypothetical protein